MAPTTRSAWALFEWFNDMLAGLGVKAESTTYRVGRPPNFNPQTEKFIADPEADKLLTREYREPFVVPEIA